MSYCILKESIHFELGLSDVNQLHDFLKSEEGQFRGLAFVGRSNVGKSSLINAIFSQGAARVSKAPGRTRQINVFSFYLYNKETKVRFGPFNLFDLPGYGHASVSKEMKKNWQNLMETFFLNLNPCVQIFNLQDVRHLKTQADQEFSKYLTQYQCQAILVLNKMDKLRTQKERSLFDKELKSFLLEIRNFKEVFLVSAEKKIGLDGLILSIENHLLK